MNSDTRMGMGRLKDMGILVKNKVTIQALRKRSSNNMTLALGILNGS